MQDKMLYSKPVMPDANFPIMIQYAEAHEETTFFSRHWHEQIEFLYFKSGEAIIECNTHPIKVSAGDLIVFNSNDLHHGKMVCSPVAYYCIIIDPSFFQNRHIDTCESKYIIPIVNNYIWFENIIQDPMVKSCIGQITDEYEGKRMGYEMAIRGYTYMLMVLLLRNHQVKILNPGQYAVKTCNIQRIDKVIEYIEAQYAEEISIHHLAKMCDMSYYHFLHVFKSITSKTPTQFINEVRISKSEILLKDTDEGVTQIALACGFNDINYFSRIFKKYKKVTPSSLRALNSCL